VDGEIEIFTKERDKDGDGKLNKVTVKWTRDSAEKAFGMEWCCKLMWTWKTIRKNEDESWWKLMRAAW
jgi:hypothetical protein